LRGSNTEPEGPRPNHNIEQGIPTPSVRRLGAQKVKYCRLPPFC
jgi:hypothetical protein